jgi:hypothetical protein
MTIERLECPQNKPRGKPGAAKGCWGFSDKTPGAKAAREAFLKQAEKVANRNRKAQLLLEVTRRCHWHVAFADSGTQAGLFCDVTQEKDNQPSQKPSQLFRARGPGRPCSGAVRPVPRPKTAASSPVRSVAAHASVTDSVKGSVKDSVKGSVKDSVKGSVKDSATAAGLAEAAGPGPQTHHAGTAVPRAPSSSRAQAWSTGGDDAPPGGGGSDDGPAAKPAPAPAPPPAGAPPLIQIHLMGRIFAAASRAKRQAAVKNLYKLKQLHGEDPTGVRAQGEEAHYTDEMLAQRRALRKHPAVVACLEKFWVAAHR